MSDSNGAVVIREAVPDDLPAITSMAQALAISVGDPEPLLRHEQLSQLIFGPRPVSQCLVAVLNDGHAVAYATWSPYFEPHTSTLAMRVSDIYVTPGIRGAGIGTALFSALKRRAGSEAYNRIIWDVWVENENARRFFKSQGATMFVDVVQMYVSV